MKTNKSFSKRIRVTRNGKTLLRKPGTNHFNNRQSREAILKRTGVEENHIDYRILANYLPSEKMTARRAAVARSMKAGKKAETSA